MLTLLLLRHAKAEPGAHGMADIDRQLAPRGHDDAPCMGGWVAAQNLLPDYIVCSTAQRTRQTLHGVMPTLGADVETVFEQAIYEANATRLLTVARRTPKRSRRLLMVGHNPGLEDLTNDLIGSADEQAAQRLAEKYPTSGLAVLTWPKASGIADWSKLTPRSAHLAAFIAPRWLD